LIDRQQKIDLSLNAKYRQIFNLGEEILDLEEGIPTSPTHKVICTPAQRDLIEETAARLLDGQVTFWLNDETTGNQDSNQVLVNSIKTTTKAGQLPSQLIRRSLESLQITCSESSHSTETWLFSDHASSRKAFAIAIPLLARSKTPDSRNILGVLQIERHNEIAFTDQQIDLFDAVARQAAVSLKTSYQMKYEHNRFEQLSAETKRLHNSLQDHSDQLTTIFEVNNAVTSILDPAELYTEIVDLIHYRFDYPFVHLFTVHPGRRKVFYEAGSGSGSQALKEQGLAYDLDDTEGIIPWVARHGEMILANDVRRDPRYRSGVLPQDEKGSELTVPLIFGGKVLGILDLQSDQLDAFGEKDRYLFTALADNIAISMRNAVLYRSENWRRKVADSLSEVAGLLSDDIDLEYVLDAILSELARTLPLDITAIWLLDEATEDITSSSSPSLHLAAIYTKDTQPQSLEIGLSPEEILRNNFHHKLSIHPEGPSSWLTEALETEQPITRTSESPYEPLGAALDFPQDYSAIAAPLQVGDQSLGVLTLAHHTTGRYGSESRSMTATFANYAAVAIENTRLLESAHEQAWVSTVLLRVAEATQSVTSLNELLETVISITPTLAGVKACLLYMVNDAEAFVPAASTGLNPDQQSEFDHRQFAAGDIPALDQLMLDGYPVILHAQEDDFQLANILLTGTDAVAFLESELLVLVPLIAHGEVLGTFLINYHNEQLGSNIGKALDTFVDETLTIFQGIAHQTATAIENMSLLKSQKEEAYITVALLQVAQTVGSSLDLDETLGTIVRLIPILAGVERTALYLWDQSDAQFRQTQSYGMPHEANETRFSKGEFPLLDFVKSNDRMFACPINPLDPDPSDLLSSWSNLNVPDPEGVNGFMESNSRLLLAFPLSVKGQVLGIFLVEEPELTATEGFTRIKSDLRLREKRLEIMTGISQQAALSIQNDQLQHEMVERERLESEMRLAREIQHTFIPSILPEFPGWDLKARWRTAREVGGDFYDFIELPDDRLGIVIADVADKGMPAALFMTLIRTLVRATAQQLDSPAAVLEKVNDLLIPDALQGMFVTIIYGVLSLDTGHFIYANAGHNLPLVFQNQNCLLEYQDKGDMAIGVIEGNQINIREINLSHGDFLVLYTDGITEAFSPDGEIYGEDSLYRTIKDVFISKAENLDSIQISAQELLDTVDASITTFIDSAPPSDDITLVVLKRESNKE
jgi:sigma-B regulation protein RsbU (phosphoserine phosphatase)